MKTLPKIVSTFLFSVVFFGLLGTNAFVEASSELNQKHIDALSLSVPAVTDDPNQTITFTPVSGDSIELQIDGAGFNAIASPYKFSSLTIGEHTLDFRYVDAADITQTFTLKLVVVPREARFNPPTLVFDEGASVTFSGTALPFAAVEFWVIGNDEVLYKTSSVDVDGNWSLDLSTDLTCGEYQLVSMVKKSGLASSTSTPLNITYCKDGTSLISGGEAEDIIKFDFNTFTQNFVSQIQQNGALILAGIGLFVIGIASGLVHANMAVKKVKDETRKILVGAIRGTNDLDTVKEIDEKLEAVDDVAEKTVVSEPDESQQPEPKKELHPMGLKAWVKRKVVSKVKPKKELESSEPSDSAKSPVEPNKESSKTAIDTSAFPDIEEKLKENPISKLFSFIGPNKSGQEKSKEEPPQQPESKPTIKKEEPKDKTKLSREEFLAKFNQLQKTNADKAARVTKSKKKS